MALLQRALCWLKRLGWLLVLLCLLILVVLFSQHNALPVQLRLYEWFTPQWSLSTWLLLFFVVGGFSGLLASSALITRLKLRNASLERKLGRRKAEIQNLKQQALKQLEEK